MDRGRSAYSGSSYDAYAQRTEHSTSHLLKNAYWKTKQTVISKLGRKEDEHVVASDSELDAKLELFKSIQTTSMDLIRIIERYQERLCFLSQAENEMGRFLKNRSNQDKTQAGKMMAAVGKSLSFAAQQRLALRSPLQRLQHEVETFRYRAIADTLVTLQRMENTRTEYRASLLWMKDVSEQLDPDTYKQLDKFRSVQAQVRKTKGQFDKLKLDSMQKVDLLAASRCNLFSQVLVLYQNALLQFWEKTSRTMNAVAESFKGYQYYEFSMLKDLSGESKKLAEITGKKSDSEDTDSTDLMSVDDSKVAEDNIDDLDRKLEAIFMKEYRDQPEEDINAALASAKSTSKYRYYSYQNHDLGSKLAQCSFGHISDGTSSGDEDEDDDELIDPLGPPAHLQCRRSTDCLYDLSDCRGHYTSLMNADAFSEQLNEYCAARANQNSSDKKSGSKEDSLADLFAGLDSGTTDEDRAFLEDLLSGESAPSAADASLLPSLGGFPINNDNSSEWDSIFGGELKSKSSNEGSSQDPNNLFSDKPNDGQSSLADMMPSALWDRALSTNKGGFDLFGQSSASLFSSKSSNQEKNLLSSGITSEKHSSSTIAAAASTKKNVPTWINLFADLDPLANPDSISKKEGQISDA